MGADQRRNRRARAGVGRLCWPGATLAALVIGLLPLGSSHGAEPPDQQACLTAYTESQRLRNAGKLKSAREQLVICSQSSCPSVVKADCLPWLSEVERSLPTIVVAAKGPDGRDTAEVRVLVDGDPAAKRLEGRPLAVDPGTHKLRFEHAGESPIERTIVVQVGVKNRRVEVSFAPEPPPTEPRDTTTGAPPVERGEPVAGYVLLGFGVLALGSFALFGLMGKSEADEYEDTCAPTKTCDEDDVSATETKLIVADVSLIVGVVAVGVGVGLILYNKLSDPEPAVATTRLELRPVPGGATLGVSGSF
jgi:hypothetical protein